MQGVKAPLIHIAGVSKHYRSRGARVTALAQVDLDIARGEFVSIVGPSGCGKSTLLYILGGFLPAEEGAIEIRGRRIEGPGIDRGVVFQEYALFPWLTVEQNIAYGLVNAGMERKRRDETVRHYVSLIGLQGFEQRYPRELSGGMRQRVAIARTLACDPDILLLDEPLGALDALTRETMQDELLRLWQGTGKTVLMVTHDVSEAVFLSQRVVVMSKRPGRIVDNFAIDLDRSRPREELMVCDAYNEMRSRVWLAVRREAMAAAA